MTVWCVAASRSPVGGYMVAEVARAHRVMGLFFRSGDELVTGGCEGGDAIAMQFGHEQGLHVVAMLPLSRQFIDFEAVRLYADEVIETDARYWARDRMEVERADKVLGFPLDDEKRSGPTSGTWYTWRYAGFQRKQSALMVMRGRGEILGPDAERVRHALAGVAAC